MVFSFSMEIIGYTLVHTELGVPSYCGTIFFMITEVLTVSCTPQKYPKQFPKPRKNSASDVDFFIVSPDALVGPRRKVARHEDWKKFLMLQ